MSESREREGRERGSWICHFYNVKGIRNSGEWEGDISDWLLSTLWQQCRVLSSHSDGSCSITLNASKWWQMSIIYRLRHSILSRHVAPLPSQPPLTFNAALEFCFLFVFLVIRVLSSILFLLFTSLRVLSLSLLFYNRLVAMQITNRGPGKR